MPSHVTSRPLRHESVVALDIVVENGSRIQIAPHSSDRLWGNRLAVCIVGHQVGGCRKGARCFFDAGLHCLYGPPLVFMDRVVLAGCLASLELESGLGSWRNKMARRIGNLTLTAQFEYRG